MADDIVADLRQLCIDWSGEQIVDGSEPRLTPTCGKLRQAASEIERLRSSAGVPEGCFERVPIQMLAEILGGRDKAEFLEGEVGNLYRLLAAAPEPAPADGVETFDSMGRWAMATFGPGTIGRLLDRADEELAEAKRAPVDEVMEEIADVVICLAKAAKDVGGDLQAAINAKMKINRDRQWSLRGDGTGYHVLEGRG